MLTDQERSDYHAAIVAMKNDFVRMLCVCWLEFDRILST